MFVGMYMCKCRCLWISEEGMGSLGAGIIEHCQPLCLGCWNWTLVFSKNSRCSSLPKLHFTNTFAQYIYSIWLMLCCIYPETKHTIYLMGIVLSSGVWKVKILPFYIKEGIFVTFLLLEDKKWQNSRVMNLQSTPAFFICSSHEFLLLFVYPSCSSSTTSSSFSTTPSSSSLSFSSSSFSARLLFHLCMCLCS